MDVVCSVCIDCLIGSHEPAQLNVFNSYYLSDINENHSICAWLCYATYMLFRIMIMQVCFESLFLIIRGLSKPLAFSFSPTPH